MNAAMLMTVTGMHHAQTFTDHTTVCATLDTLEMERTVQISTSAPTMPITVMLMLAVEILRDHSLVHVTQVTLEVAPPV